VQGPDAVNKGDGKSIALLIHNSLRDIAGNSALACTDTLQQGNPKFIPRGDPSVTDTRDVWARLSGEVLAIKNQLGGGQSRASKR
jgi:hypothetical protein